MTAHDVDHIQNRCEELGIVQVQTKPILPKDLRHLLRVVQHDAALESLPDAKGALSCCQGMRVLLVEDNFINQRIATRILDVHGVVVDVASNGLEALEMLESQEDDRYHAVLMDIQMPLMDGYEATARIRCQNRFQQLPIIAMTAHALIEEQERCLTLGMDAHIPKPFEPEELMGILGRFYRPRPEDRPRQQKGQETMVDVALPNPSPDLDPVKGLRYCAGRKDLYRSVLVQYARDYAGLPDRLRGHLDREEWTELGIAAHSFKGLSESIGASELAGIGAGIERGAETRAPELGNLLRQLEDKLPIVLARLQSLLEVEDEGSYLHVSDMPEGNPQAHVDTLHHLLAESDSAARDYWKDHETLFAQTLPTEVAQQVGRSINLFDFGTALSLLQAARGV
jgi:FOG: CheY-like receiver